MYLGGSDHNHNGRISFFSNPAYMCASWIICINDGRLKFPVSSTLLGGPVGQRWHGGLLDIALLDCGATEVKVV
tara:strand:+ start:625 stop:846 length:222 start_codon:yes stop_codon:yes gene_type:complete